MFDLIWDLLWARRRQYRYGRRIDPLDPLDSYLGDDLPAADTANQDYFRENAPSAKKRSSQNWQPYDQQPYLAGEEEVAANGFSVIVVLLVVALSVLLLLYFLNPAFHLQVDTLLHH